MLIKDLQAKQGNVNIELDVVEVAQAREFQKFGKAGRVATASAKDESGASISLTLWNDDVDKVKAGDKIKLTNGYVNEWQGELQLTTGRMGKMEIIGKSDVKKQEKVYTNQQPEENVETDEEFVDEI